MKHKAKLVLMAMSLLLWMTGEAYAGSGHMLLELQAGQNLAYGQGGQAEPGPCMGLTLGVGGKFKGNPTRIFLIGRLDHGNMVQLDKGALGTTRLERDYTSFGLGARLLWPLAGRLRLHLDFTGGRRYQSGLVQGGNIPSMESTAVQTEVGFGAGLQYRFFKWLSLGLRGDWSGAVGGDVDFVREVAGMEDQSGMDARIRWLTTFTIHL